MPTAPFSRYAFLLFALGLILSTGSAHAQATDVLLTASDGNQVFIDRDAFGVPHIVAESEAAAFYGQGYAVAQDRLFQMEIFWRTALGRLSEAFGRGAGDANLIADQEALMTGYTAAERTALFNALSPEVKAMLEAYRDGINAYLTVIASDPSNLTPFEFIANTLTITPWTVDRSVAIAQTLFRRFGQNGGKELTRLQECIVNSVAPGMCDATGIAWLDANRPINDPSAPTTIPGGGPAPEQAWHYSGMQVRDEVIRAYNARKEAALKHTTDLGFPPKFGSFAALISGSHASTGNAMLLGAPQMGTPVMTEASLTHEVELDAPTLHIGGMTIAGLPGMLLGHNEHFAMSLTSGQTDNSDIFVEVTFDQSFSGYLHCAPFTDPCTTFLAFEQFDDNIPIKNSLPEPFTFYRTVHGPVVADDLANNQAFSIGLTFWGEELSMLEALYDLAKATDLTGFETASLTAPLSFNLFYAGPAAAGGKGQSGAVVQTVKYFHAGKYQDRTDGVDPRLPHSGIGNEEWGGFLSTGALPQAADPAQGYFVNWNNKPEASWNQGDNVPWIPGGVFYDRVNDMDTFVGGIALGSFTYANLKDIPAQLEAADGGRDNHGTYTQAIELDVDGTTITDENLNPPGQSGFIAPNTTPDPHFADQWASHVAFQLKDQLFGQSELPLPVALSAFEATLDALDVVLSWRTESESNNAGFELQHAQGADWQPLVFVEGVGTTSAPQLYEHRVTDLLPGRHSFRLKQVDFDGAFSYSEAVEVLLEVPGQYHLSPPYPNPFTHQSRLTLTVPEVQHVTATAYDMLGRRVARLYSSVLSAHDPATFILDGTSLPVGQYVIHIVGERFQARHQVTRVK